MRAHLKNRKGAVMIMASVFMVVAVIIMAFGMDLSQYFVQANQLQTAADAAAHAGAIQMFSLDSTHVADTAVSFAAKNKVLTHAPTFAKADVTCGTWDPASLTFTTTSSTATCGALANAVRVTGHDPRQLIFSTLWNLTGLQTTRSATAWVSSNVVSGSCVRPFGIAYWMLTKLLDPTNPDTTRDLTPADEVKLASMPASSLTFTLKTDSSATGNFAAVDLPGNTYQRNIETCNPTVVEPGTMLDPKPGKMSNPTIKGAETLCEPYNKTTGDCGNGQGGIGMKIKVPLWVAPQPLNGKSTPIAVKIVATFSLDNVTTLPKTGGVVTGHWVRTTEAGTIGTKRGTITRIVLVQ